MYFAIAKACNHSLDHFLWKFSIHLGFVRKFSVEQFSVFSGASDYSALDLLEAIMSIHGQKRKRDIFFIWAFSSALLSYGMGLFS